jgi:hypothetical protein
MKSERARAASVFIAGVVLFSVTVADGTASAAARAPGYWLAAADGGVFSFNASFDGSGYSSTPNACSFSPQAPSTLDGSLGCSAIAATPSGDGYWLLNAYRSATAYGQADSAAQSGCTSLNGATGSWTGMASSVTGNGFWLVSANGGVMGCGDVQPPYGGVTALALNGPVVGMASTPGGKGYWLAAADGGVFAFGDATYFGSMGDQHLNEPVVGIAATIDGNGYWLVAADGGVFSFGGAAFSGSMGGHPLAAPVVGIAANPEGTGYWIAARDGGVFAFGDAPFDGSMAGHRLGGPVVGIAASP